MFERPSITWAVSFCGARKLACTKFCLDFFVHLSWLLDNDRMLNKWLMINCQIDWTVHSHLNPFQCLTPPHDHHRGIWSKQHFNHSFISYHNYNKGRRPLFNTPQCLYTKKALILWEKTGSFTGSQNIANRSLFKLCFQPLSTSSPSFAYHLLPLVFARSVH